jgi:hypothetical protein
LTGLQSEWVWADTRPEAASATAAVVKSLENIVVMEVCVSISRDVSISDKYALQAERTRDEESYSSWQINRVYKWLKGRMVSGGRRVLLSYYKARERARKIRPKTTQHGASVGLASQERL